MNKWQKWSIGWLSSYLCLNACADNVGADLGSYTSALNNAYKVATDDYVAGNSVFTERHYGMTRTGAGWKTWHVTQKGWAVFSDVGVLYHGRTTISLADTRCILSYGDTTENCPGGGPGEVGRGTVHNTPGRSASLPVFNIGISYRF